MEHMSHKVTFGKFAASLKKYPLDDFLDNEKRNLIPSQSDVEIPWIDCMKIEIWQIFESIDYAIR